MTNNSLMRLAWEDRQSEPRPFLFTPPPFLGKDLWICNSCSPWTSQGWHILKIWGHSESPDMSRSALGFEPGSKKETKADRDGEKIVTVVGSYNLQLRQAGILVPNPCISPGHLITSCIWPGRSRGDTLCPPHQEVARSIMQRNISSTGTSRVGNKYSHLCLLFWERDICFLIAVLSAQPHLFTVDRSVVAKKKRHWLSQVIGEVDVITW